MIHKNINKFRHHIKHAVHHIGPKGRRHKNILKNVSEKLGLVYFGSVDQHRDDHEIVRGITASSTHKDNHLSVGSIGGYDVQLLDRSDSVEDYKGKLSAQHYIVLEIKLQRANDVPQILMVPKGLKIAHFDGVFASTHMQPIPLPHDDGYSSEFESRYEVKSAPTYFESVKQILDKDITRKIAAHFWPLGVELNDGILYIYLSDTNLTKQLIENVIQNGLWLAGQIDAK